MQHIIDELKTRPARQRPTQAQTSALIDVLATATPEELKALKQVDLSYLVSKGLGFSQVEKVDGSGNIKTRDAKKDALIQSIELATAERRALLQLSDEMSRADVAALAYKQESFSGGTKEVENFMHDIGNRIAKYIGGLYDRENHVYKMHTFELERIAARITGFLTMPHNGVVWSASTILRTRVDVKRALGEFIETKIPKTEPPEKLYKWRETCSMLMTLVYESTRSVREEKQAIETVSHVKRARKIPEGVTMDAMLRHAKHVLSTVDVRDTTKWREVMLSICLATGRRSVEVFCTGTFERVNVDTVTIDTEVYDVPATHLLSFTGQVKTRGASAKHYAANPSYIIPTLLPAELVARGMTLINSKRDAVFGGTVATDNKREIVRFNNSFHGELEKPARQWAHEFLPNVPEFVAGESPVPGATRNPSRVFTPHRLRSLYAHCCNQWLNGSGSAHATRFIADVLGDARGSENKAVGVNYEIGFRLDTNSLTHL